MIQTKARQQGGAVIITIPAGILKLRGIKAGDVLDLDVTSDGFVVHKVKVADPSRYMLGDHKQHPGPID